MNPYLEIFNNKDHTFIIAEAGSNWKVGTDEEDLEIATKMIQSASEAGADAIKFQTFRSETVYAYNAGEIEYEHEDKKTITINELFERLSMKYEMIEKLAKISKENNIMFMSTPFSVEDAKQLDPFVEIHKVASFEINHVSLLEFLASTKKPILISTGASSYDEIDFVVDFMNKNSSGPISLLQCTSKYPCPIDALNLSTISTMRERYNLPIGFSDHSVDPIIGPLTAIGLGAIAIEKHFTLNKSMSGPDHFFAVDPPELNSMVKIIREADKSKGIGIKEILDEEKELRRFATRSIQAIQDIQKDEILKMGINFEILRPGNQKRGEEARFVGQIEGKIANTEISKGEGILRSDCT